MVSTVEILPGILDRGDVKHTGTPAEYPGFGHAQNPRVSSQTRTRHGFFPSEFHPPDIRVSITWGASLLSLPIVGTRFFFSSHDIFPTWRPENAIYYGAYNVDPFSLPESAQSISGVIGVGLCFLAFKHTHALRRYSSACLSISVHMLVMLCSCANKQVQVL